MQNMDKNDPEIIKYVISGETEEEINDQLNDLEIDLIKKFGNQPDSAKEVMQFVTSLRESVMKRMKRDSTTSDNDKVSIINDSSN